MLWSPSQEFIEQSNISHYVRWLDEKKKLSFSDYRELWKWSVDYVEDFWESIWEYFSVIHEGTYTSVLSAQNTFDVSWFAGVKLNYAEHIFRNASNHHPAIVFKAESKDVKEISWGELRLKVASLQHFLKNCKISKGDCVVAYLPCIPESTMAMLATVSAGAIWASCSPDFGTSAVIDRFSQIHPKILIAVDQYTYGGKSFDKSAVIRELVDALPSLEGIILISEKKTFPTIKKKITWWEDAVQDTNQELEFVRVPFAHPIWILYSSGTTGLPKAFVHSQGGILLEQLKYAAFHNDYKPGDLCFWYTTTGWMMWNYIHGSLLLGGSMVLYDGSVAYPDLNALWKFIQDAAITHFGTSAGYILANLKEGIEPQKTFDLSSLRSISSTGSTLPPEGFEWVYKSVKGEVWLASMSGGSDVCSAFVGGNPTLPIYAGEIQCRALGCDLKAYDDDGRSVIDQVGEMVIAKPMPSMPIYFWNDPDNKRYKESYFETFPNVWRHGDWIRLTAHDGIIIYGRSDATLNRGGIRIGTSEVYRAVDRVDEVKDSLIICIEQSDGTFWMPLFVVMKHDVTLTDSIKQKINAVLRREYSPRHVPDEIISVPDIPYTISGKKTETPVKKIFMGKDPAKVISSGSLKNPDSMDFFISLAKKTFS